MKKPRSRWPLLLALLFGAGTWWGIGWWLSPRAYWEGRYHIDQFTPPVPTPPAKAESTDPQIEELGKRLRDQLYASILDRQGRYLLVERQGIPPSYEVIDLHTRRSVAKHLVKEPTFPFCHGTRYDLCHAPVGNKLILVHKHGLTDPYFPSAALEYELWRWDVLRNEFALLKQYPRGTTIDVSQDGSTLLEIERRTALLPSLLLPGNVPNLLAGLAEAHLRLTDVAVLRIRSLPDLALRSTMTQPWMHRQNTALLSADGAYLIQSDTVLPSGMTSPHVIHKISDQMSELVMPHYVHSPKGCRVYETKSLSLITEYTGYEGAYVDVVATHPDFLMVPQANMKLKKQKPGVCLHLPSMTWKEGDVRDIAPLTKDLVHSATYVKAEKPYYIIDSVARDGTCKTMAKLETGYFKLIPHAPQYVVPEFHSWMRTLPAWLVDWLLSKELFEAWIVRVSEELQFRDYATDRTLLSRRSSEALEYTITDPWLVITEDDRTHFDVAVYALPLPSWSPWWARGIGVVVALLCWLMLTRGRGHALLNVPPAS